MTIYVTGDCHGAYLNRLSYKKHPELRSLTQEDSIFFLGDWGVVWGGTKYDKDTVYQLKQTSEKPFKKFILLGNHDNWDWAMSLPESNEYHGVRQCVFNGVIYPNTYIICEPTILTIEDKKFFCIPGAECHEGDYIHVDCNGNEHSSLCIKAKDGSYTYVSGEPYDGPFRRSTPVREEGKDWWPQEAIDVEAAGDLLQLIKDNDIQIDYVLSHDCPAVWIEEANRAFSFSFSPIQYPITQGEEFLQRVAEETNYKWFFHGHLHLDKERSIDKKLNVMCLFHSILKLED